MRIETKSLHCQGGAYGDSKGLYYDNREIEGSFGYLPAMLHLSISSDPFFGSWRVVPHDGGPHWTGHRTHLLTDDYPSACDANLVTPSLFNAVNAHCIPWKYGMKAAYIRLHDPMVEYPRLFHLSVYRARRFPITVPQWRSAIRKIAWHSGEIPRYEMNMPHPLGNGELVLYYSNMVLFIQKDGRVCS